MTKEYKPRPRRTGEKGAIMNSVNLIGRLTADPEVSYYGKKGDQVEISRFTLAVDRVGSEETDFIRCVAFWKSAEFANKYLDKGQRVGITGRLQTGSYEDRDGIKRYTSDVIVERITFADSKREDSRSGKKSSSKSKSRRRDEDDDD